MNRPKLIYYVAFPLVSFGLCAFFYYLGYQRGKQWVDLGTAQKPVDSILKEHEQAQELTFFKTLKDESPTPADMKTSTPEPVATEKPIAKIETKKSKVAETSGEPTTPKITKGYAIQISAFRDIGKAHELMDQLKKNGFSAYSKTTREMGGALHRVYVGTYDSKERAQSVVADLRKKGFNEGFVTSVGGK